jgi:predicted MFS family arabinose efflux permease
MAAGTLDFTIEQGATFNLLLTWKINNVAVNLTGYTARLQARVDVEDIETVLTLTTANGGITLGGVLGTISLDQTAVQTTLLPAGTYVYDLELIASNATVTRLVQGELLISAEVTR